MRHLIEITAADVEGAGLAVDQVLPSDWITAQGEDAEARATKDGHFVGRISRSGRADMVVRGVVTATVEVPCARCLKPTPIDVRGELALFLKPNAALAKPSAAAAKTQSKRKAAEGAPVATAPKIPSRRDDPRASKSEKGKTARVAEYEFSSEEAEHDEYDGETIVLDPFLREAILLELPNFPLCSESCAGISPGLAVSRAEALNAAGNASSLGATATRANPFEALKHLVRGLPNGSPDKGLPDGSTHRSSNGSSSVGAGSSDGPSGLEAALGSKKARAEAKFASTHSAPSRRGSSKRAASRGKATPKKTTKH